MEAGDNPFIKNRPSTRVTNAPGGNSSLSFGNYMEPGKTRESNAQGNDQSVGGGNSNNNQSNTSSTVTQNVGQPEERSGGRKAAGNMENNRSNEQNDKRTNVKVNQPPGGASSIIFG